MFSRTRWMLSALLGAALVATTLAADSTEGMTKGTPDLKSAGPLAFGPDGILFVGDPQGAAIFAIDTGDRTPSAGPINVEKINEKVAAMLGTDAKGILINAVAVNPASGNAYLSVSRGRGPDGKGVLFRVGAKGKIEEFPLKDVKFAKVSMANPAEGKNRTQAITGLAFLKDRVLVAGLSNEEFASKLLSIPYPFKNANKGTTVEFYHGSHGRMETKSPVRTFVPYTIGGQDHILAAYTCTPLVKVPLAQLKPGEKVQGVTIAELGNRNRPLDMIVYQKGGKDFILMANSARGVMKISTDGIDKIEAITSRIKDKAGLTYQTIDALKGVQHLAKLDKDNALVLTEVSKDVQNLQTVPLP